MGDRDSVTETVFLLCCDSATASAFLSTLSVCACVRVCVCACVLVCLCVRLDAK